MKVSATALRQNIYAILDQALETGEPVEIERKGRVLKIVPPKAPKRESKLAKLKDQGLIVGDIDDLVHIDWSHEWTELKERPLKEGEWAIPAGPKPSDLIIKKAAKPASRRGRSAKEAVKTR